MQSTLKKSVNLICSLNIFLFENTQRAVHRLSAFIVSSKLQHDQNNSNGSHLISVTFNLWVCNLLDFLAILVQS